MGQKSVEREFDPPPPVAARLAGLARRHYGYARRVELLDAGLSPGAIHYWSKTGRLHRRHHGVYAIGYPRTEPIALAAAAVLAGGPRAALSHRSALALWGLSRRWPDPPEVSTPADRRAAGIRWHRSRLLGPRDVRTHLGIRTTSAARTLLDLTAQLTDAELHRLLSEARIARRASPDEIDELTRRLTTHPGATRLRAAALGGAGPTRSELERRFVALLERHGLPKPLVNTRVAGFEVDFLFGPERLIVELDGWEYHRDRARFTGDRRRDAATLLAGFQTVRLTAEDLAPDRARATAQLIRAHLERRRAELERA